MRTAVRDDGEHRRNETDAFGVCFSKSLLILNAFAGLYADIPIVLDRTNF